MLAPSCKYSLPAGVHAAARLHDRKRTETESCVPDNQAVRLKP